MAATTAPQQTPALPSSSETVITTDLDHNQNQNQNLQPILSVPLNGSLITTLPEIIFKCTRCNKVVPFTKAKNLMLGTGFHSENYLILCDKC